MRNESVGVEGMLEPESAASTRPPWGSAGGSRAAGFWILVSGSKAETGGALKRRETMRETSWSWWAWMGL